MRHSVLDIVRALIAHSRRVASASPLPSSRDTTSTPHHGGTFPLPPASPLAVPIVDHGPPGDAAYASTVGPLLTFLQSRVSTDLVVMVADVLLELLPYRRPASNVRPASMSRGPGGGPAAAGGGLRVHTVSGTALGTGTIVSTEAPSDADPWLLTYLSRMGHAAAVWTLLQRDSLDARLRALYLISAYEQLQYGGRGASRYVVVVVVVVIVVVVVVVVLAVVVDSIIVHCFRSSRLCCCGVCLSRMLLYADRLSVASLRSSSVGFIISAGHAVFMLRSVAPAPVSVSVYRAVMALMLGLDARATVAATTHRTHFQPAVSEAAVDITGALPTALSTVPIRHPYLAPVVWKLLARASPSVQALGLRDWTVLLLGSESGTMLRC
jgi:hypothetical protein